MEYFKRKRQEKMWKDLKELDGSPLYSFAVTHWEMNRPLRRLKRKFWRLVNKFFK